MSRYDKMETQLLDSFGTGDAIACKRAIDHLKHEPGFDINGIADIYYNGSWLMEAAHKGHAEICEILLDEGASPNKPDTLLRTPMHIAIEHSKQSVAQLLLSRGANLDARDNHGETPLHVAVLCRLEHAVQWLAASGADLGAKRNSGESPLQLAIAIGTTQTSEFLIDAGAPLDTRDSNNRTLLHTACRSSAGMIIAAQLIKCGLDINAQSEDGKTPLHIACENGHVECVNLLLQSGACQDIRANGGRLPLHLAALHGRNEVLTKLLENGASIDAQDWSGKRAVHLAKEAAHLETIGLLLSRGSSPHQITGDQFPIIAPNEKIAQNMALTLIANGVKAPHGAAVGHLDLGALTAKEAAIHGRHTQRLAQLLEQNPVPATPADEPKALMALAKRLKRQDELALLSAMASQEAMMSIRVSAKLAP